MSRNPPREIVDAIVVSLQNNPHDWVFSRHEATHSPSGVVVWIGSCFYGMHIEVRRGNVFARWGDVVAFGWTSSWRRRIWRAIQQVQYNQLNMPDIVAALLRPSKV